MLSPQEIRSRKSSQDAIDVPIECLDSTCYFITPAAFDTLLQCTTNHSPTRDKSSSPPRSDRASLWTSSTNFFTGSLVCTDPPLILATGNAVSVLERDWQNYFVLLDLNNVAPYGRLPSLFSTFSCIHAISKGYPLGSFGEIHWIVLGLSPLRNHIPTREPRGKRWRSNSLPSPQTPDEACYPHPELNPSLSVTFDLNQATNSPSPKQISSQNASRFFRQAPTRSIHSLVRARLQCLFSTSSPPFSITVRLFFGSNSPAAGSWRMDEGLMIAMNEGVVSEEDGWVLGGHGTSYLTADKEYTFSIVAGLAADGIYRTPAVAFRQLRLVRRWSEWSEKDTALVWPQAYVEIADASDPRIAFSLGPVAFEREAMRGREWVGVIPTCIEC